MGSVNNLTPRAKEKEPACRKQSQVHREISKAAGPSQVLEKASMKGRGPEHDPERLCQLW